MKSPAYQWYPKDILSSERVAFLSLAEEGAYRRAMDYCWLQGSIPSDPGKLAVLIGKKCTPKIASAIIHLFEQHPSKPDRLVHDKQEEQRESQRIFREKQGSNSRRRWLPNDKPPDQSGSSTGIPPDDSGNPRGGNPLHSAFASATEKENTVVERVGAEWWAMFRRAAGVHIDDEELEIEIGKFKNRYPNKHTNECGALINTWVSRIGHEPHPSNPVEKRMQL